MNLKKMPTKTVFMSILCAFALSACAEYPPRDPGGMDSEYLPFSIKFDQKGNMVVVDAEGKPVPPREAAFPIPATSIEKIEALSYVQYRGSHVALIVNGGRMYIIKLPHTQ